MKNDSRLALFSLRSRRLAAGLTRDELAALAKCSPSMLTRLEQGYVPTRGSAVFDRLRAALDRVERR